MTLPDLIDIGANLAHESFTDDLDAVLDRAGAAGVRRLVLTGSDLPSSRRSLDLAQQHPGRLFATAGLHPHHAADFDDEHQAAFADHAQSGAVVSLGECGLDYFRDLSPRDVQRRAFASQLRIAIDAGKPVFLHQRDAHDDFHAILREHRAQLVDCVVHCFTGTREALEEYLDEDCHIGITGWICDERRGAHLLDDVCLIPDHRLMIETDAPYLMPRTIRPRPKTRRNEPANLPYVARTVAEARGVDVETIARQTTATAERFFRLPAVD